MALGAENSSKIINSPQKEVVAEECGRGHRKGKLSAKAIQWADAEVELQKVEEEEMQANKRQKVAKSRGRPTAAAAAQQEAGLAGTDQPPSSPPKAAKRGRSRTLASTAAPKTGTNSPAAPKSRKRSKAAAAGEAAAAAEAANEQAEAVDDATAAKLAKLKLMEEAEADEQKRKRWFKKREGAAVHKELTIIAQEMRVTGKTLPQFLDFLKSPEGEEKYPGAYGRLEKGKFTTNAGKKQLLPWFQATLEMQQASEHAGKMLRERLHTQVEAGTNEFAAMDKLGLVSILKGRIAQLRGEAVESMAVE